MLALGDQLEVDLINTNIWNQILILNDQRLFSKSLVDMKTCFAYCYWWKCFLSFYLLPISAMKRKEKSTVTEEHVT